MKPLLLLAAVVVTGCSNYNPDLGETPFFCGEAEPRCPDDYECVARGAQSVCELDGDSGSDTPMIDAPPAGFQCASDGSLESNDTIATASNTGVGPDPERTFGPVSICPVGDKDHYKLTIPASGNQALEVTVTWESGPQLAAAILGPGGAILAAARSAGTMAVRACATPGAGTYYALVNGAADAQNNYRISMKLLAACAAP